MVLHIQNSSKCSIYLNFRAETIKLVKISIEEYPNDLGFGKDFLNKTF